MSEWRSRVRPCSECEISNMGQWAGRAPPGAIPSPPPGRALTGIIAQPANRVALKVIASFFFIFSSAACDARR